MSLCMKQTFLHIKDARFRFSWTLYSEVKEDLAAKDRLIQQLQEKIRRTDDTTLTQYLKACHTYLHEPILISHYTVSTQGGASNAGNKLRPSHGVLSPSRDFRARPSPYIPQLGRVAVWEGKSAFVRGRKVLCSLSKGSGVSQNYID